MDERPLAASAIYLINFAIHIRQVSAKNNVDYMSPTIIYRNLKNNSRITKTNL